jgi:hypothetical protein
MLNCKSPKSRVEGATDTILFATMTMVFDFEAMVFAASTMVFITQ